MRRAHRVLFAVLFLLPLLCSVACATGETQALSDYAQTVNEEILSQLDGETQRLLADCGLADLSTSGEISVSWNALSDFFLQNAKETLRQTLQSFLDLALPAVAFCLLLFLSGEPSAFALETAALAVLLLRGLSLLQPLLSGAATLLSTSAAFVKGFLPVYAGLVAFSGAPSAALHMQTLVLGLCEGLSACAEALCVRRAGACLGVCMACVLSPRVRLPKLLASVNKTMNWVLGLLCTVFTGVLGARSVLSAAVDTAAGKSVRFLLSSAIPIVGAAMSDAYSSLAASIYLMKGSIAAVGVVALLALHLPLLLRGLCMLGAYRGLSALCGAFGGERAAGAFQLFSLALKFVLLLCALELFVLLIAVGLLLQVKGGV